MFPRILSPKRVLSLATPLLPALFVFLAMAVPSISPAQTMQSPDAALAMALEVREGRAGYSLKRGETVLLNWAPLGLVIDGVDSGAGVKSLAPRQTATRQAKAFPVVGVKSQAKVVFNEYRVSGLGGGQTLLVRMFDDGLAFRYEFSSRGKKRVDFERTAFGVPDNAVLWMQDSRGPALNCAEGYFNSASMADFPARSESEYRAKNDYDYYRPFVMSGPVTAVLPGDNYLFLQEAGTFNSNWCGAKYAFLGDRAEVLYFHNRDGFDIEKGATGTPWRVVIAARSLNGLVNCDIVGSLAPAPDKKLFPQGHQTPWIKPGRGVWTWLARHGAQYEEQFPFIEMAGELGYEYNLVDEGYEKWKTKPGETFWNLLENVTKHGKKHKVGVWIWKHWSRDGFNDPANDWKNMRDFMKKARAIGIVGFKIDFMDSDSQERLRFYDTALRIAAENKLMVNFHGANIPSGEIFTWPNELTREAVLGLEFNSMPPRHIVALPFTRLVAGHADFTPGAFNHDNQRYAFNHGDDPAVKAPPSWSQRLAQLIVYTSPLQHMVSAPEDMRDAAPAGSPQREVLRRLATVWDETRVLDGAEIGKTAPFARRAGDVWFVGVLNSERPHETIYRLNFLQPNTRYKAVLIADNAEKPDAWVVSERLVTGNDTLPVKMRGVGGFAALFVPVK